MRKRLRLYTSGRIPLNIRTKPVVPASTWDVSEYRFENLADGLTLNQTGGSGRELFPVFALH